MHLVPSVEGPVLRLYRVSRLDMGAYMCIARNGVPPAVSKRIQLGIDCNYMTKTQRFPKLKSTFNPVPPMMWVPAQLTSAPRGGSIRLRCFVEAHPEALVFWEHHGRMMQAEGNNRVDTAVRQGKPSYKVLKRGFFCCYCGCMCFCC